MVNSNYLIVGLGNPGGQYSLTRHNAGFIVVDELAAGWNVSFIREKWHSLYTVFTLSDAKIHLLKPLTYMNLSGKSVASFYKFFKISRQRLLVVHDDLDMEPGRIKLTLGGGDGGHNGIRSVVNCIGGRDFYRLKIGIGRPGKGGVHPEYPVEKYVLSPFEDSEYKILSARFTGIAEGVRLFLQEGPDKAMNLVNSFKKMSSSR